MQGDDFVAIASFRELTGTTFRFTGSVQSRDQRVLAVTLLKIPGRRNRGKSAQASSRGEDMGKRIALAFAGMIVGGAALADAVSDCIRGQNAQQRLQACSNVIGGAYGANQKAAAYRIRAGIRADAGAAAQAVADFQRGDPNATGRGFGLRGTRPGRG